MKFNNSWTMRALFRVNGVSIDYLEKDYKRRLCLSCSPGDSKRMHVFGIHNSAHSTFVLTRLQEALYEDLAV